MIDTVLPMFWIPVICKNERKIEYDWRKSKLSEKLALTTLDVPVGTDSTNSAVAKYSGRK